MLIHFQAHHGHFVCEIFDESESAWYLCNDEEVTRKFDRPQKRQRLILDEPDSLSSKDAYMLVYSRPGRLDAVAPPAKIIEKVYTDNAELHVRMNQLATKRADLILFTPV